jgi:putative transposase
MPVSKYFVRQKLPHKPPSWVADGAVFFITICAKERETRPLMAEGVPEKLLKAVIHYHEIGRWWARLLLVMPDHVHGLVAVPREEVLRKVVAQWKSYTAKAAGI